MHRLKLYEHVHIGNPAFLYEYAFAFKFSTSIAMTSVHVLNLPLELLSNVVATWLDIKSVTRLDTAICSHARRAYFLSVLTTYILPSAQDALEEKSCSLSSLEMHEWMVDRKVRASELIIGLHDGKDLGEDHVDVYTELFNLSKDTLRELHLFNLENELMECVLSGCKQLKSLHVNDCVCEMLDTLLQIIRESTHLNTLQIANSYAQYISWSNEELQVNLCNNHITKLSITGNVFSNETLVEMTRLMPHLTSFELRGVCSEEDGETVYDHTYVDICKNCPLIKHISFNNFVMMDHTFVEIVNTLTDLQSVHICSTSELTDESIVALMDKHAHSLQHLCLEECDEITLHVTMQLLSACTNLRTLHLIDYHRSDIHHLLGCTTYNNLVELHIASDVGTRDFLHGKVFTRCAKIQVLGFTISHTDSLSKIEEELRSIRIHFTSLRKVVLYSSGKTEKKLRKFVRNLPQSSLYVVRNHLAFDVLSY